MRTRKSSSGDTSPIHPYMKNLFDKITDPRDLSEARRDWTTWGNVKKDRNGRVISFKIVTKNV